MATLFPPPHPPLERPALPRAKQDPPEMRLVVATRQALELATRQLAFPANAAAHYFNLWVETIPTMGKDGDPELWQLSEEWHRACARHIEKYVIPAIQAYANAMDAALEAGCGQATGGFSAETVLKTLIELHGSGQLLGSEALIPADMWDRSVDRVALEIERRWVLDKDPRAPNQAIFCLHVAEMLNTHEAPGIRALRARLEDMGLNL